MTERSNTKYFPFCTIFVFPLALHNLLEKASLSPERVLKWILYNLFLCHFSSFFYSTIMAYFLLIILLAHKEGNFMEKV